MIYTEDLWHKKEAYILHILRPHWEEFVIHNITKINRNNLDNWATQFEVINYLKDENAARDF